MSGSFKDLLSIFKRGRIRQGIAFLLFIALACIMVQSIRSQPRNFDYELYPRLNYDFKQLTLDLNIEPDPLHLDGVATYVVSPRIDSLSSLHLDAVRLDIQKVQVEGQQTDYSVENDTLQIELGEYRKRGQSFQIMIQYRATPNFGLLKDTSGTIWTSRLPRSNAHWLPVPDHPRVSFQTDLKFSVPPDFSVVANGSFVEQEVISVDKKQFHFQSERSIPATDLSFAAGPFRKETVSYGVKSIEGYFLPGSISEQKKDRLMNLAYQSLKQTEKVLKHEYPYSAFSFAVLPDHKWESKSYAASMAWIYQNKNNPADQLRRAVWGQWFGSFQREEQWMDAAGINLYQSWLNHQINPNMTVRWKRPDAPDLDYTTLYDVFGAKHWKQWKQFYRSSSDADFKKVVGRSARKIISKGSGVYNWNDYARIWYKESGQPWFSVPRLEQPSEADTSKYVVDTYYDPRKGQLALSFKAVQNPIQELVSLLLIEVRSDKNQQKTVTFTGEQDSVVFNVSAGLQNIYLEADTTGLLKLDIHKPKTFWISQLRNGETEKKRVKAARSLSAYSEDPDLQLLLDQVLKQDSTVKIRAALYATLSKVLKGAAGTEEMFLEALRSESRPIQMEALRALEFYKNNDRVKRVVRNFASNQTNDKLLHQAIRSYAELVTNEEFQSYAQTYTTEDTTGRGIPVLLKEWAKRDSGAAVLEAALDYTADRYSYKVRSVALKLLRKRGAEYEAWLDLIPTLIQDLDPRIRYLAATALKQLSNQRARQLAEEHLPTEYDLRVAEKLNDHK